MSEISYGVETHGISTDALKRRPITARRGYQRQAKSTLSRRDQGELFQKQAEILRNSGVAPLLLPLGCTTVPAFHPFVELIVRHQKPFPSQGGIALGIRKKHPQIPFLPVPVPIHGWATFQLNRPQFATRRSQDQIFAVAIGFRAIDSVARSNQERRRFRRLAASISLEVGVLILAAVSKGSMR